MTVLGVAPSPGSQTLLSLFRPEAWPMLQGMGWLLLTNLAALVVPRLISIGVDLVEGRTVNWPFTTPPTVTVVVVAIIAAAVIGAAVRTASRVVLFSAGRDVEQALRRTLFLHLGTLSPRYFGTQATGDLMSRMTADLTNIRLLSGFALLNAVNALMIVVMTLPVLIAVDPWVALWSLSPFPLIIVASQMVSKVMFVRTRESQEATGKLSALVQESLAGQLVVRALSQEDAMASRFQAQSERVYTTQMRLANVRVLMGPLIGLMGSMSIAIALYAGGQAVIDERITIGDVVEINVRIMQLMWPMIAVGFTLSVWQRGKASLKRINDVLEARPDIVDGAHTRTTPVTPLTGAIALRDLTITLGTPPRTVLNKVSLDIAPGSFVGVVGKNGSGKSVLLKAIVRQLDVERGAVSIDGTDGNDWHLTSLRDAPGGIAVVPEDGYLFSATLKENLLFGAPPNADDDVDATIDLVDLRRDVARMPDGISTMVGERGVTLSGGQRQRTALGRALLAKPSLLILDDSLSAVDVETEQNIITSLRTVRDGHRPPTIIMVSHRLSVLRDADVIIGLDGGRVVEQGRHDALLQAGGLYATLWGEEERRAALRRQLEGAHPEKQGT